jgi:hypothetical protein
MQKNRAFRQEVLSVVGCFAQLRISNLRASCKSSPTICPKLGNVLNVAANIRACYRGALSPSQILSRDRLVFSSDGTIDET